jgi:hypothetical protein
MRRLAVAAVAITAVLVAACGGDNDVKLEKKTLRFTERDTDEFGFIDAAPKDHGRARGAGEALER